jgi:hypothetical protein
MKELQSELEINASPLEVWKILVDFDQYPSWNPFIPKAKGKPEQGERLTVRIQPPGGKGMTFRPEVLVADPGRELRWKGKLMLPGLFDGEHIFLIEPLGLDKVRFIQKEKFSGILVPLMSGSLNDTQKGFDAMNAALKMRAEKEG